MMLFTIGWVVGVLSLALVILILGGLTRDSHFGNEVPPGGWTPTQKG